MNYLVIYPGRFQPFHLGHKATYDYLVDRYGDSAVYIATSDKTNDEDSPFSYDDKTQMTRALGIPAGHVQKVKNPYRADEIVKSLGDEEKATTALIFAISAKDGKRFTYKPESYLQPLPTDLKGLKPMTQHAYVEIAPTVNFRVKGVDADSATKIRELYKNGNQADRDTIITDLYGKADPHLVDLFDKKIGQNDPEPVVSYGQEGIYAGDTPGQVMRESRLIQLKQNIQRLQGQLQTLRESQDYIDEKRRWQNLTPGVILY